MASAAAWLDEWPTAYPCRKGPWTVTDGKQWAIVEPESGEPPRLVEPSDDPTLVALPAALTEGHLLSYRHHRRAVVKTGLGYRKIVAPKKTAAIVESHQLATRLGLDGPPVLDWDPSGFIDLGRVAGVSLHQCLIDRQVESCDIIAVANALVELHGHRPSELPSDDANDGWIETTRRADPEFADTLRASLDDISPMPDDASCLIHTDLHDKNLLLTDERATLIDLDGLKLGHPATDLGNLTAHLELRALQGLCSHRAADEFSKLLVATYAEQLPVDDVAIELAQRRTWVRLAALYHFRKPSRHLVSDLLRLARQPARL